MKKLFSIIALVGVLASSTPLFAQDSLAAETETPVEESQPQVATADESAAIAEEEMSFHEVLKDKFIQGDVTFMTPILICLILVNYRHHYFHLHLE